jgi:phosphoribosylformimino-5-aminoimidazole carboxamide ribotide isomerase
MQIWPAIDLRGGKCVRLKQGDYARECVFGEDPAAMARHWVDQGARQLHLVDLDAARSGRPTNLGAVRAILAEVDVPCQLGGGIRSEETISRLLDLGVERLVIGTSALKQPGWFRDMCAAHPGRLVLGIDARAGRVATDGWTETSDLRATDLAAQFDGTPIAAIVYTDIATDGMLSGPNERAMVEMRSAVAVPVIASGGITSTVDVTRLAAIPMAGCIIGMALYAGHLTLEDALAASRPAADM